jgi:hypothetical protein
MYALVTHCKGVEFRFPGTLFASFRFGAETANEQFAMKSRPLVGAGAPPPGTHGRDIHGPDRSRLPFSNFGSMIDAQGWGFEVTTTGYGEKQGGLNESHWYTDQFSGTSSASPMIVGTLACLNGVLRHQQAPLLTPPRARSLLRETGSPQITAPDRPVTQQIGSRPDLKQLIKLLTVSGGPPNSRSAEDTQPAPKVQETKTVKITRKTEEVREITITRYHTLK